VTFEAARLAFLNAFLKAFLAFLLAAFLDFVFR